MRIAALALALGSLASPAGGQSEVPLYPGQRVWARWRTPAGALAAGVKGTLEGVSADSVRIRPTSGSPAVSLPVGPQTQLFVFAGQRSSLIRGAAIGGGLGVAAGAILGAATGGDCSQHWFFCFDSGDMAAMGALGGGFFGLVTGALVGALSPHDTWAMRGWDAAVKPIVAPRLHGVSLGLSLAF